MYHFAVMRDGEIVEMNYLLNASEIDDHARELCVRLQNLETGCAEWGMEWAAWDTSGIHASSPRMARLVGERYSIQHNDPDVFVPLHLPYGRCYASAIQR